MPQERIHARLAAAKRAERFGRWTAAAHRKDFLPETLAGLRIEHAARHAGLLERAVGVGGKHLRPLVAVIAGRIAAAEDVRERVREAVIGWRMQDGGPASHFAQQGESALFFFAGGAEKKKTRREH